MFFCLLPSNIHPHAFVFTQPVRGIKRKGRGRKDEEKEGGLLTVQILPRWHPSQPHPSRPDANGCFSPAPSPPCPNHPQPPPTLTPTHTPCPHPPLSQYGKGDLTQKLGETNDSNESRCPPANVCSHYRCSCKWVQMALFLAWQTAATLHCSRKFLPESSCELCVLKSSEIFVDW